MTGILRGACAFAVVACAIWGSAAQEAHAAETPERFRVESFAEVLPPTTIFFLEIPDYTRARAAYRATPRWGLWWEGAGRRLISQLLMSAGDEELTAFFRSFAAAAALPRGKVAFAIEGPDPGDEFGMPMSSFLAEVGGGAEEFKRLAKKMCGAGLVEGEEAVIQRVGFEEMDELLVGSAGGLVMGGLGKTGLNGLLSRFAERPWQSLAGSPAYKLAKSRALEGAHFMTFANYTDIWRMLAMELDEDWIPVERTGLPQLAATSLSGRFTPDGVVDKLSFILRGRARGVWKLLRPEPLSRKAWELLPDFTSGFVTMKLPERTQPFLDLLRTVDPEIADEFLEPYREFREETGINFERDVLRLTTGEYTAVFLEEDPNHKPQADARVPMDVMPDHEEAKLLRHLVILVELTDPARARAMMDRLVTLRWGPEPIGRKRRFGNLDGWELEDQGWLYVAGSDGIGMLALSPEPIERLVAHIAKGGARLVDSAEFRKATQWLPADTGFAAYSDVRKILRSLPALAGSLFGRRQAVPADMPKAEDLMKGLTPLTACVHIEKPGFAFEIHSPDGIWAYYFQMMAHCLWRFEEEPRHKRRLARSQILPRVPAGADPKLAKAYAKVRANVGKAHAPQHRIAILSSVLPTFKGTPYEKAIESTIAREKTQVLTMHYRKTMMTLAKLKMPQHKIEYLTSQLPLFAGTRYEKVIEGMIEREKSMRMAKEYQKVIQTAARMRGVPRTIDERIAYLEQQKPRFTGTRYEKLIQAMIERAKAERREPEPLGDEDDVF